MQKYINNFRAELAEGLSSEGLTLDALGLPSGSYRLSLTGAWPPAPPIEVITATVLNDGSARLARGVEQTERQTWPEGAYLYAGVTAGMLADLHGQISDLRARILDLQGEYPEGYYIEIESERANPDDWMELLLRSIIKHSPSTEQSEALDLTELSSPDYGYQLSPVTVGGSPAIQLGYGGTARINIGNLGYPDYMATEIRVVLGDDNNHRGVIRLRQNAPFGDPAVILAEVPFGPLDEPTSITILATASAN